MHIFIIMCNIYCTSIHAHEQSIPTYFHVSTLRLCACAYAWLREPHKNPVPACRRHTCGKMSSTSIVVEWKAGRYAGIQQEIPSRCVLGGVNHLSGEESISVEMGKSAGARKWEAIFLRVVPVDSPSASQSPERCNKQPDIGLEETPTRACVKRRAQPGEKQISKRVKTTVPKPSTLSSLRGKKRNAKVDDKDVN